MRPWAAKCRSLCQIRAKISLPEVGGTHDQSWRSASLIRRLASSSWQVLEQIEHARHVRDEAETELATLIDHAVDQGIGWPEIAARLGVTRQAARQHYQRRHREGSSHEDRVA